MQVSVHPVVAERARCVLSACQYVRTAPEYASRLIAWLATETRSEFAAWLNWPPFSTDPVATTPVPEAVFARLRSFCVGAPVLSNDPDPRLGVASVAAAPVRFRASICGALVVANGARPYTPADLDLLAEVGAFAVLEYERLKRAPAIGLLGPQHTMADFVHDLRQPLGIMEACACLLEFVLPLQEHKAREHLLEFHTQIDAAGRILDLGAHSYASPEFPPLLDEAASEARAESRAATNSAMSLVT
jgi:hypothetical protein